MLALLTLYWFYGAITKFETEFYFCFCFCCAEHIVQGYCIKIWMYVGMYMGMYMGMGMGMKYVRMGSSGSRGIFY